MGRFSGLMGRGGWGMMDATFGKGRPMAGRNGRKDISNFASFAKCCRWLKREKFQNGNARAETHLMVRFIRVLFGHLTASTNHESGARFSLA